MSRKLTIEQMQAIAKERGGKCLSKKYVNQSTKLEWECAEGHRWKAVPDSIKHRQTWCPDCGGRKRLTIKEMREIAKSRGGKCLSKKYVNQKTNLEWKCGKGHRWKATSTNVKRGKWCSKCGTRKGTRYKKRTIENMQEIAKSRGGKCLSKKYVNMQTNLEWECAEGHRWKSKPVNICNAGSWCAKCAGILQLTIEEMQEIAKSRGGKCLSKKYVDSRTKLEWECAEGHRWKVSGHTVKSGTWCPKCAGVLQLTIEQMQAIAKERGGKCLSKKYVNKKTKLEWECANGHRWKANSDNIEHNGAWCPECSIGISERICRAYFSQLFSKPFPKSYPNWLNNSAGNQMELDGYCKSLKIAFEHQGEQHYTTKPIFVSSKSELIDIKNRDKEKENLCNKNGVRLIVIPTLFTRTKLEDLQQFIHSECKSLHIRIPAGMLKKKINLESAWVSNLAIQEMETLHSIAESRNGKCLSKMYINSHTKLEWECANGHRWEAKPNSIKNGSWCLECSGYKRLTIEQMQAIAKERGGKCLSKKYVNQKTKLEWECANGHRWKATSDSVKGGSWCQKCYWQSRRKTV